MITRDRILAALTAIALCGALAARASTSVSSTFRVPGLAQSAPQRVVVFAVLGNAVSRRAVEDALASQLNQAGVTAVAGYSVSPDTADLPKDRLAEVLASAQADAALVCRWHLVRQATYNRSGTRMEQSAYGEASLLDGATLTTVWSAETRITQSGGFRDSAPEFARSLVGTLQDDSALYCRGRAVPRQATGGTGAVARF